MINGFLIGVGFGLNLAVLIYVFTRGMDEEE